MANLPLSQRGSIIFLRALLAVLFMNLVLIASELFGMTGTMLISVLFLTGYFIPLCARKFMELRERRKLQKGRCGSSFCGNHTLDPYNRIYPWPKIPNITPILIIQADLEWPLCSNYE